LPAAFHLVGERGGFFIVVGDGESDATHLRLRQKSFDLDFGNQPISQRIGRPEQAAPDQSNYTDVRNPQKPCHFAQAEGHPLNRRRDILFFFGDYIFLRHTNLSRLPRRLEKQNGHDWLILSCPSTTGHSRFQIHCRFTKKDTTKNFTISSCHFLSRLMALQSYLCPAYTERCPSVLSDS
jgi:hypothetical protein